MTFPDRFRKIGADDQCDVNDAVGAISLSTSASLSAFEPSKVVNSVASPPGRARLSTCFDKNWIGYRGKYDRDVVRLPLHGGQRPVAIDKDQVRRRSHQLDRLGLHQIEVTGSRPVHIELDIAAFGPAQLRKPSPERGARVILLSGRPRQSRSAR